MISPTRHKQRISWTFSNDAMAISAKEMPKNHADKERFAAASSCIEKGILTLLFPRKRRRSSLSPFISHRVLEAVAVVDLYHVTLGYDETTSLTSLSWCNNRGVNSIRHCHYTMASADSKFDDFCLQCIQFE